MPGNAIYNLNNFLYKNLKYVFISGMFIVLLPISTAYFTKPSCSDIGVKNLILTIHRNRTIERLFVLNIHNGHQLNSPDYNTHIDKDLEFSIDAIEAVNWSPMRQATMCKASVSAKIKQHGISRQDIFFTVVERDDHQLVANLLN
jgi:hypothetical protein